MQQYEPYSGTQFQRAEAKYLTCPRCKCDIMEERVFGRFRGDVAVIVGAPLPQIPVDPRLRVYICAQCGWPVEHELQFLSVDIARLDQNRVIEWLRERAPAWPPEINVVSVQDREK